MTSSNHPSGLIPGPIYPDAPSDPDDIWAVTDDDVEAWLEFVQHMIPDDEVRTAVLDWMAFVAQWEDVRPPFQILLGSEPGIGKALLFAPLEASLTVRDRQVHHALGFDLDHGVHAGTRLLIADEVRACSGSFERLRGFIADPPPTVRTYVRQGRQAVPVQAPNTLALAMLTSSAELVQSAQGTQRLLAYWSPAKELRPSFYCEFTDYYRMGGAELAAVWLRNRSYAVQPPLSFTR